MNKNVCPLIQVTRESVTKDETKNFLLLLRVNSPLVISHLLSFQSYNGALCVCTPLVQCSLDFGQAFTQLYSMIPRAISDIGNDWIIATLKKIKKAELAEEENITLTSLSLTTTRCSEELFECCDVTFSYSKPKIEAHFWRIKLVPSDGDLREIVLKHGLFRKELLVYQQLIPQLMEYVDSQGGQNAAISMEFPPMAQLLYGDYDETTQAGVMVFTDLQSVNYRLADPEIQRFSSQGQIEKVITTLADFHATCTAFEHSRRGETLEDIYPFLKAETEGYIWFHADMQAYLQEMYETCLQFLKSVPGQEETSKWFEQRMKDPQSLKRSGHSLKTLVHGDLWHNNVFINTTSKSVKFGSWQLSHLGSAATDLCFFLCSSTTTSFRKDHWDRIIRFYYDKYALRLGTLEPSKVIPSFEDFMVDVKASIPVSIFFCANLRDLDSASLETEALASLTSDMELCYGRDAAARSKQSIQNLHGSFHKLQNSYSLYMMHDWANRDVGTTPVHDEEDDEDDEDEEGGIIISFGPGSDLPRTTTSVTSLTTNTTSGCQAQEYKRALSDNLVYLDRQPVIKVPTVATDKEMEDIMEARCNGKKILDPRKARALRRKLYLDLYSEVAQRMLI